MDTQMDREPTRSNPDKPRHETETRTIDTGSTETGGFLVGRKVEIEVEAHRVG